MALKRMVNSEDSAQFKFEEIGDKLEGYFVASEEFMLNGKPTRKHLFETSKGLVGVLGSKNLNDKLDELIKNFGLGLYVVATFVSTIKTRQPKPMKVFNIDYDEERRFESGVTTSLEETSYEPSEEELTAAEEEEASKAFVPTARTSTPAAVTKEAQSRVQSVLTARKSVR